MALGKLTLWMGCTVIWQVTHGVSANAHTWHDEVLKSSVSLITAWASKTKTPGDFIPSLLAHLPPLQNHHLLLFLT